MSKKEDVCIHNGHRERLTDLVLSSGIDNVSKIQAVEFFLTYIFPRGDVNPLAHRLLDKYGSFSNIIDAEISDLSTIEGINTRSAKKIKLFAQMIDLYALSKSEKDVNLKNTGEFLDMLEILLQLHSTESLFIFAFNNDFKLIQKKRYSLKQVRAVCISPLELLSFIISTNPSYLVVAHNHPNGSAISSSDDGDAVKYIQEIIHPLDCKLLDSFVVGNDGIYSEFQSSFVRLFSDSKIII